MKNKINVTVIVVTYNSFKYVNECFNALNKINQENINVKTVMVDNSSSDGTVDEVRNNFPWVEIIESGGNYGFAGGNNIAIKKAIKESSDYVYLLNPDTEVDVNFLVEAVAVAERDKKIGSVQSLLLLHPEKELVNSTGNAIHFLGFGYCMNYRKKYAEIDQETINDVAYFSGAGVLLQAKVLQEIGLFDEQLFIYHEDLDLGWRIRLAGYRNVVAPKSIVYHKYEFSRSVSKWYFMERNRYIVLLKNMKLSSIMVILPGLMLSECFLTLSAVRGGWWKKKFSAMVYFLRPQSWVMIFRERDRVQLTRKVSDAKIFELFTAEIRDQDNSSLITIFVANPLMELYWKMARKFIV